MANEIVDALREIETLLDRVSSKRFVPYWSMRAKALLRVVEGWGTGAPSPADRDALYEEVASLRSEIQRTAVPAGTTGARIKRVTSE